MNKVLYDFNSRKISIDNIETNIYYKNYFSYFLQLKQLVESNDHPWNLLKKQEFSYLKEWIDSVVPFLSSNVYFYSTRVYFIFTGLTDFPICRVCKKNKIIGKNVSPLKKGFYFPQCCSIECRNKDPQRIFNIEQTLLKKYGVRNANQSKEIQAKALQTRKDKNNGNYFSRESLEQIKSTCLERYGVENYTQTEEYTLRSKDTFRKHFGADNNMKSEDGIQSFKKALIDKYGVDNIAKCPEIQAKIRTRFNYLGKNFDTKPELAFFIWLTDNQIDFEYHNGYFFDYEFNGKSHRYFPDFKIGNTFYEIKGDHFFKDEDLEKEMICPYRNSDWNDARYEFECKKYEAKHQCMLANGVVILTSIKYQKYLDYVSEKYGKTYLDSFKKT